ncbi:MAG: molybdopterin molybdotransferase MoeA [Candidatus Aminicenantes bacterium]|nr:molybdopterin molybdotransferase MoeA [Candidatus Aminicenantes bacterium]
MERSPMLSAEEAEAVLAAFPLPAGESETVPLSAAHGRFLAADLLAPVDMPEFDKSAMDGYACIAGDASPAYEITETIAAGTPPRFTVRPGRCARIMTGAMLPEGADRVVKRECTVEENGLMRIVAEDPNPNVRRRGEDLRVGDRVLSRGDRLQAAQVALLASLGIAEAVVARSPRVGILTTGSELVPPGPPLRPGQVYDSNSFSLAAQIRESGAEPLVAVHVADDREATVRAIASQLESCDVLILSGGVSAGDFDYVPAAMRQAGFTLHMEKIAVQPGMPTVFASRADKIAFGLPGNPVSTFVIFEVFIKPLLLRLQGHAYRPPIVPAIMAGAFRRSRAARSAFVPIRYEEGRATLIPYHGSAHLHALGRANALLRVAAGEQTIPAGRTVDVRLL